MFIHVCITYPFICIILFKKTVCNSKGRVFKLYSPLIGRSMGKFKGLKKDW